MTGPDETSGRGSSRPLRVVAVHTHPVQYLAPLFEMYAERAEVDFSVIYCSTRGATSSLDAGFGIAVEWDLPLLEGYVNSFLERPLSGWNHPIDRLRKTLWYRLVFGRVDLVIAYGYNYPSAVISLIAARMARAKWALVADNHTLESVGGHVRRGKVTFLRGLGLAVDGILAGSRRSERFYESVAPGKVSLLPHAIDEKRFASEATSEARLALRRKHDVKPDDVVFLFVGKLTANKRVGDLLEAAKGIPSARVWVVGAGPEEGSLKATAGSLGARAVFFGFVNQRSMPAIYAAADVVVLPSRHETFGLVVSEGAAVGKPALVSSACGVVDSLVKHGESGMVFTTGDTAALEEAMKKLLDPAVRERMCSAMITNSREWTTTANVDAFIKACRRLTERVTRSGSRSASGGSGFLKR